MFSRPALRSATIARPRPSPNLMQLQKHPSFAYRLTPRELKGMALARAKHARGARERLAHDAPIHGASVDGSGAVGRRRHRASGPSSCLHTRLLGPQMGTTAV